jgi:hypothetical protein
MANMNDYSNFELIRHPSSDHAAVLHELNGRGPFAAAFVDGVQTLDVVLSDLELMDTLNVQCVVVDDFNRLTAISQVEPAVNKFVEKYPYAIRSIIGHPRFGPTQTCVVLDKIS